MLAHSANGADIRDNGLENSDSGTVLLIAKPQFHRLAIDVRDDAQMSCALAALIFGNIFRMRAQIGQQMHALTPRAAAVRSLWSSVTPLRTGSRKRTFGGIESKMPSAIDQREPVPRGSGNRNFAKATGDAL